MMVELFPTCDGDYSLNYIEGKAFKWNNWCLLDDPVLRVPLQRSPTDIHCIKTPLILYLSSLDALCAIISLVYTNNFFSFKFLLCNFDAWSIHVQNIISDSNKGQEKKK